MDTSPAPIRTVPVARGRSLDRRVVVVVAVLVALSVLRPWGAMRAQTRPGSSSSASSTLGLPAGAQAAATLTAASSPRPSIGPDRIRCSEDSAQLVSLDRLGDWTVRTWIDALPVVATGPADPAIGMVVLESPAVLGIGMCLPAVDGSPSPGPGGAGAALVDRGVPVVEAWATVNGQMRSIPIEALHADRGAPDLAILYRPSLPTADRPAPQPVAASPLDGITPVPAGPGGSLPASRDQPPQAWPPGRYVLRLAPMPSGGPGAGDRSLVGGALFIAIEVPGRS